MKKTALTLVLLSTALALLLLSVSPAAALTPTKAEKKVIASVNKERAKKGSRR